MIGFSLGMVKNRGLVYDNLSGAKASQVIAAISQNTSLVLLHDFCYYKSKHSI